MVKSIRKSDKLSSEGLFEVPTMFFVSSLYIPIVASIVKIDYGTCYGESSKHGKCGIRYSFGSFDKLLTVQFDGIPV